MGDEAPLEIRISQNGYARGWYWEVVAADRTVLGRGLAATHAAAKLQAVDYIELLHTTQRPPWKHAG
jgi:hypothetical protein